jgi:ParB family chromosome partitioning protein
MGMSLQNISAELEEARSLKAAMLAGEGASVLQVDCALIDPSFMSDRLSLEGEDFDALVASIAAHGQQVPVLLRPHPEAQGRYQTVFGHRRIKALGLLGRKAEAIVRNLSDVELVVAQGKENAERRDLSFIERALFAHALESRGFERSTIMAALSVDKTELSRLLTITHQIPVGILTAIGPAPKAGRPRFMQLAEALKSDAAKRRVEKLTHVPAFLAQDTDQRFASVLEAALAKSAKGASAKPEVIKGQGGEVLAELKHGAKASTLKLPHNGDTGFADYLQSHIASLYADYMTKTKNEGNT